jgi:predicted permease
MMALSKGLPPVMGTTMLVVGLVVPVLTWRSWNHSRPAWAFLIALVAVFGTVDFFGAPKIRALLHVGLWHAMILPGLQIVCVMALAMVRGEYRDRP